MRVEALAGFDISDRDRAVVDADDALSAPAGPRAGRKLEEFQRMPVGIAQLDGGDPARGGGQRHRTVLADRHGTGIAGPAPCGVRVVGDERQMLEDAIAGGRIARIGTTGLFESLEIDAAFSQGNRGTKARALKVEKPHVGVGDRLCVAHVESDRPVKGGEPPGIGGNEREPDDRVEFHVMWHGVRFGSTCSCTVIRQHGSLPIVPDL